MIGERLAEVRKDHGDTQEELAELKRIERYLIWQRKNGAE